MIRLWNVCTYLQHKSLSTGSVWWPMCNCVWCDSFSHQLSSECIPSVHLGSSPATIPTEKKMIRMNLFFIFYEAARRTHDCRSLTPLWGQNPDSWWSNRLFFKVLIQSYSELKTTNWSKYSLTYALTDPLPLWSVFHWWGQLKRGSRVCYRVSCIQK